MLFPIKLIPDNTNIQFMKKRVVAFTITIFLTIGSIFSLFINGMNFGIDFTGGIVMEVRTEEIADLEKMRNIIANGHFGEISLQNFGSENDVIIRVQTSNDKDQAKTIEAIKQIIAAQYNAPIEYRKIDYVGPKVGQELVRSGFLALAIALLAMMIYIWLRFEWQYGIGGILALIHDTILVLGFYSVTKIEFNLTSIAAILTVIGYSINDSVVIYDRIRENIRKFKKKAMEDIINQSLNETLSRTILTVTTTFLATLALVLFGGEVLKSFSSAMLFGIVIGTYSSIFVSAPILIHTGLRN